MSVKATRVLIILAEIFLVGYIVSRFIQHGLPTNFIFWIAVAIEIAFGYLTYCAYKLYLTNKNYKRWNLIIFVMTLIGIGVPIALFYLVDFLKPAGGTWLIYLSTVNSFYLYRIIKKQPVTRQDIPMRRLLPASKVLQSVYLSLIFIMILIIFLLPTFNYIPVFRNKSQDLVTPEIIFAVITIAMLAIGIYLPRIAEWFWKTEKSELFVYFLQGYRISLFEAVAVIGLILGILGGAWYACLPFLILPGLAMVFTFPTAARWEGWKAGRIPRQ